MTNPTITFGQSCLLLKATMLAYNSGVMDCAFRKGVTIRYRTRNKAVLSNRLFRKGLLFFDKTGSVIGSGFKIQDSSFKIQDSSFKVQK
jgi:hypothetical protein